VTIEQIVAKYLYQHKVVTLPGIGKIELTGTIPDPELTAKNKQITLEGIVFTDNSAAPMDESFVAFFAQQRGKMKALALSDIESHLQLAKQMINIGNHYEIPGIGTISKQRDGKLVLAPGAFVNPSAEPAEIRAQASALRLRMLQESAAGNDQEVEVSGGISATTRRILIFAAVLLLIGAAGWMIYYYYYRSDGQAANPEAVITDTVQPAAQPTPEINTGIVAADSNLATTITDTLALVSWKAIIREFGNKEEALTRYRTFSRMATPVLMETADSVNFRMYVMLQSSIADTAGKIDSLSKFYARRIKLEKATGQ
jgi:hypothetical protein